MSVELMKQEAINHFAFEGTLKESDSFGCGHINDTFLLVFDMEDGSEKKIILQRMNKNVFPRPVELMENVMGVQRLLR